ncbi:MAG: SRPBCC family protein [Bacteroidia bacterium]
MMLTFHINKSPEIVKDYLTDMEKFVEVHPVIYKFENKGKNEYLIFERLEFLFIPVSFTYPAKIELDEKNNRVIMSAIVKKVIHINMHFDLEKKDGKTKITEVVMFRSFLPVNFLMERIFKKQHTKLFENIEATK